LCAVDPATTVLKHERVPNVTPNLFALDQRTVKIENYGLNVENTNTLWGTMTIMRLRGDIDFSIGERISPNANNGGCADRVALPRGS
jgi:hypothetical protein